MLAPSRNHRVEVRYNVTTDFPHLGLHSASASGDIGLVQYALSHGQPVNSVLDGVLPLHAACAGGSDLVVNFLIGHGADVNAPRLPRRYSDRNRDAAAPIVGTSGSTPLHFAAANGHLMVLRTLLSHGAIPDRSDKHGITPELIARQNGWVECAEVLAQAVASIKAVDRTAGTPDSDGASRDRSGSYCPMEHLETSLRKRLHFKRSIDHALKGASADTEIRPLVAHSNSSDQEPPGLDPRLGSQSPDAASQTTPLHASRRPSLSQVVDEPPVKPASFTRSRRPRSAGTGAEPIPRKLNSKLSLLSLFKKSNIDGANSSVASVSDLRARSPSSPPPISLTTSPARGSLALPISPRNIPTPLSSSPRETSHPEFQARRLEGSASSSSVRAYPPHPTDLHNALTARNRSISGTSTTSTPEEDQVSSDTPLSTSGVPTRSGILRMHNRSSSSHGSTSQPPSLARSIRFENSTSDSISLAGRTRSPGSRGQLENMMRVLSVSPGQHEDEHDRIPDTIEESPVLPQSPPPIFVNAVDDNDDELDEEYGVPLSNPEHSPPDGSLAVSQLPFSINVPPPTEDIVAEDIVAENRLRGDSISSASTTTTTSTWPHSSLSDSPWSVATPSTPHLHLSPLIAASYAELEPSEGIREALERKPPVHLDIDISSISSHAQAEALVQRAQQSILSMEQYLEPHVRKDSETGRTQLSAKLAEYGETLAIERLLKEKASAKALDQDRGRHNGGVSLLSATKPSHIRSSRSSSEIGSSSDSTSQEEQTEPLRHTARSLSDDVRDAHIPRGLPSSPPAQFLYTPPRSRTPNPDLDSDLSTSVLLSRTSTTPCDDTPSRRGRERDPTRSVQKLTRMGFSTIDNWHRSPLKGGTSRSPPPRLRFGIRTLMQSFQGK
ncbi:hypothetical protein BDN67DRAFT_962526 [Paxillus ammoniavirescens]|nr:hypothetical protein BDN67DRAFT_962526 [Paxillus ammoniavirescens]